MAKKNPTGQQPEATLPAGAQFGGAVQATVSVEAVREFAAAMKEAQKGSEDAIEKVYLKFAEMSFDPKYVLAMGRYKPNMLYWMLKHVILESWFGEYYMDLKVKVHLSPETAVVKNAAGLPIGGCESITTYPFYRRVVEDVVPKDFEESQKKRYWHMIEKFGALTVSEDGLGRKELFGVMNRGQGEMMLQERLAGLMGKRIGGN
jgi:hypothetical protein